MKKNIFALLMLCSMTMAWAEDDGFVNVATASQMRDALKNDHAKVRLTADIYLSDLGADFDDTFCSTFYGTLDGDGHAIKGDHYADNTTERRNRTYLFTYSDGATFKNLTFKHIRKNSQDHSNQAIITSQAKNGCVFDNITFDNVGTWTNYDNAGSAAGYATDCTFSNITVRNSDFTVDDNQAGCVVGHAIGCTFENIKVENCESTSAAESSVSKRGKSGGIVGRSDTCTFNNVEVLGSYIKTYDVYGGGIAGYSSESEYRNCMIDDQSCVCSDGALEQAVSHCYVGGIVGYSENKDKFYNCINSALIACNGYNAGGIAGICKNAIVDGCLNTGMIMAITLSDVDDGFYNKYKTISGMTSVTKTYQGKEYVIRKYEGDNEGWTYFGGIGGNMVNCNVTKCTNYGSVQTDDDVFGPPSFGGIAGLLNGGTISDCLCDFYGCSEINAIAGRIWVATVKNCLNLTTYKDFTPYHNWENDFSGGNNYSMTTSDDARYITKITEPEVRYGKIGYLLGENWEQNVSTDPYPTPTGSKGVYHTREVSNEYGTVCLPFALESNEDITYYTFNPDDVKNEDGNVILEFRKTDSVEAGYPALYRTSKTGELTFSKTVDSFSDMPHNNVSLYATWAMLGVYEEQVFTETTSPSSDHVYYVSGGEIRNAKRVTVAPYRAWIGGPRISELNQARTIQFVLEDEDGSSTALQLVADDLVPVSQNAKAYTLYGTEAGEGYRGIVIRGGKKVMVNN